MTAIIFDTETTGGKPPALIEAGGLILCPGTIDLRPVDSFVDRYNPGVPSTMAALATHHILDEELANERPASEFALPEDCEYLIGHNVDYDWEVIDKPRVKRICTLALARDLYPDLDSHKLGPLAYHFMGQTPETREMVQHAHGTMVDIELTRHILRHLVAKLKRICNDPVETWEDLWRESEYSRVPRTMPFGKHKGTPIGDLPKDYIDWLLREERGKGPDKEPMDAYLYQALVGA